MSAILPKAIARKKEPICPPKFIIPAIVPALFPPMSIQVQKAVMPKNEKKKSPIISLIIGDFFFSFFGITAFCTCIDIGGNKAGTIAGIMNFGGQIGSFFLAIAFGKIADIAHSYNTPMFVI